jgi:hypothetical protein
VNDQIETVLGQLVSSFVDEPGDWDDVLARTARLEAATPEAETVTQGRASSAALAGRDRAGRRFAANRRVWLMRASAVAVLSAAAAVVVLFVPGRHPSLLDNAAAAMQGIGSGPVLHLVYASGEQSVSRLNVKTGKVDSQKVTTVNEVWYDRPRHIFKQVFRSPIGSYTEWKSPRQALDSQRGTQPLRSIRVPPEVTLFSDYQDAIAQRKATSNGEGTAHGHQVFFLEIYHCALIPFPGHPGSSQGCGDGSFDEKIAIDKHTYLPVAVYANWHGSLSGEGVQVLKVELLPRHAADLTKPATAAVALTRFGVPRVVASRQITTQAAAAWLGRPPVGLRPSLAGRSLSVVLGDRLNPARAPQRRGLELLYGSSCQGKPRYDGAYVLIQEAAANEPAYNSQPPLTPTPNSASVLFTRAFSNYPECAAPKIGFYSGNDKAERVWAAVLRTNGLNISIYSPRKSLTIQAIRELLRS